MILKNITGVRDIAPLAECFLASTKPGVPSLASHSSTHLKSQLMGGEGRKIQRFKLILRHIANSKLHGAHETLSLNRDYH